MPLLIFPADLSKNLVLEWSSWRTKFDINITVETIDVQLVLHTLTIRLANLKTINISTAVRFKTIAEVIALLQNTVHISWRMSRHISRGPISRS